jgi:hypothetical protein
MTKTGLKETAERLPSNACCFSHSRNVAFHNHSARVQVTFSRGLVVNDTLYFLSPEIDQFLPRVNSVVEAFVTSII